MEVDLGGFDLLMPEPEGDHGAVDVGLQETHRGGVAQHVGCDVLGNDRWASLGGGRGVLGESLLERVAAEPPSLTGWEQWVGGTAAAFGEPRSQDRCGDLGQRRDPVFRPFPTQLT